MKAHQDEDEQLELLEQLSSSALSQHRRAAAVAYCWSYSRPRVCHFHRCASNRRRRSIDSSPCTRCRSSSSCVRQHVSATTRSYSIVGSLRIVRSSANPFSRTNAVRRSSDPHRQSRCRGPSQVGTERPGTATGRYSKGSSTTSRTCRRWIHRPHTGCSTALVSAERPAARLPGCMYEDQNRPCSHSLADQGSLQSVSTTQRSSADN